MEVVASMKRLSIVGFVSWFTVKCGKEWGKRDYTWTWTYPTYPTYPTGTYPAKLYYNNNTGTAGGQTLLASGSTHAHK